jgi:hypothetical protein
MLVISKIIRADEVFDHVYCFELKEVAHLVEEAGMKVIKAEKFLGGLNSLVVAEKT